METTTTIIDTITIHFPMTLVLPFYHKIYLSTLESSTSGVTKAGYPAKLVRAPCDPIRYFRRDTSDFEAQKWGARCVVGVDIDDVLVRMAWKRRRAVWSTQEPIKPSDAAASPSSQRPSKKRKRGESSETSSKKPLIANYFPISCQHMFGPLPIPPSDIMGGADSFPHNVSFRRADWVNEVIPEDTDGYDVVFALSVSKWIHLNGGDDGIKRFFQRVFEVLKPGGTFVFEPQQWESYTKARKLDSTLQENAKNLRVHPDQFPRMLQEIGFGPMERLGVAGEGRFRRPVELYVKADTLHE
ncbi:hypothetical protein EW146_g7645 [Bondarzewia mesenterica]|uniref:RNA methyltransferase n=1 Tax=Bondarzewia mesenterica TaxID=1095465 RepID=A0A4S4LM25_9AGAM|nr:hypothetical protein EW146_g7645 [Bondarzewia mesenterica]